MNKYKIITRQIKAGEKIKNNSLCWVEFKVEEGFNQKAEAALLRAAADWIEKHDEWGFVGMQIERRQDYTLLYIFCEQ